MNKKWANFICKYVSSGPRFLICWKDNMFLQIKTILFIHLKKL
jgi:hypothetical protein